MNTKNVTEITPDPHSDPVFIKKKWEGLARGQILNSTIRKFNSAIRLIDYKAQVMLVINSVTIPVGLSWVEKEQFYAGAIIAILTAVWTMFFAIVTIYPRSRLKKKDKENRDSLNLLHWGDISSMSKEEYLSKVMPIVNDPNKLTEAAMTDIYDISANVLRQKFFWIRFTYYSFFLGNIVALIVIALF